MSYAHPRIEGFTSHHMAYDHATVHAHVQTELTVTPTGTMGGFAHISGDHLARMCGQTTPDLINLHSIEFSSASTNVGAAIGAHISLGSQAGDTLAPFATTNRVSHVERDVITQCHAVVPPASGNGAMATYSGLGTVISAAGRGQTSREAAAIAVGRQLRWSGAESTNLAGTCTQIGEGAGSRWLIPNGPGPTCAMSKLWAQNETSAEFCGGRYLKAKRTDAVDLNGSSCTVVTSSDFAAVKAQLSTRLTTQSELKDGVTFHFETFGAMDGNHGSELVSAGYTPTVSCSVAFHRTPTSEFISGCDTGEAKVLTKSDFHEMIGETAPAVNCTTAVCLDPSEFASKIMQLSLSGQADKVTASMPDNMNVKHGPHN